MVGAVEASLFVACTDDVGGIDVLPPTPKGMAGVLLFVKLAVVLSPSNNGRLVVNDGWFT